MKISPDVTEEISFQPAPGPMGKNVFILYRGTDSIMETPHNQTYGCVLVWIEDKIKMTTQYYRRMPTSKMVEITKDEYDWMLVHPDEVYAEILL